MEAKESLEGHPPGTFLVRFSLSQPGNFAISYVSTDGHVQHSLIEVEPGQGYRLLPEQDRVFLSVKEVVEYCGTALR